MDWEAPADAWYVWVGVSILSLALAAVVLGLPTGLPPDAGNAADAIEGVAGTEHANSGSYDHDADQVKIDGATVALRNGDGTDRATLYYGSVVPVNGNESLMNVTRGASLEEEYGGTGSAAVEELLGDADEAYAANTGEWRTATGELVVRTVRVDAHWYEKWSTEPADRAYISAEVTDEEPNDAHGVVPEEITFEYDVRSEREVEFGVYQSRYPTEERELTIDGTGAVDLDAGASYPYPMNVELEMDGEESDASLEEYGDRAVLFEDVRELDPETVARNFDWLDYDDASDEFYLTLVFA